MVSPSHCLGKTARRVLPLSYHALRKDDGSSGFS